jgi:Mn2+/Fe2+ NRAMP family transporter
VVVAVVVIFTKLSLFKVAIVTQTINAVALPLVFYFLIKLTNDKGLMGEFVNNKFQKYFSIVCTVVIVVASAFTLISYLIKT